MARPPHETVTQPTVPFEGDTGSGGEAGAVPAPLPGDATKFLNGAGGFSTPTATGTVEFDVADNILAARVYAPRVPRVIDCRSWQPTPIVPRRI